MLAVIGKFNSDVRGEYPFDHRLLLSQNTLWGRSWCLMFEFCLGLIDRFHQLIQPENRSTRRIAGFCDKPPQLNRLGFDPYRLDRNEEGLGKSQLRY